MRHWMGGNDCLERELELLGGMKEQGMNGPSGMKLNGIKDYTSCAFTGLHTAPCSVRAGVFSNRGNLSERYIAYLGI